MRFGCKLVENSINNQKYAHACMGLPRKAWLIDTAPNVTLKQGTTLSVALGKLPKAGTLRMVAVAPH